jgi:uncharacterized protein (UPF0276 family)
MTKFFDKIVKIPRLGVGISGEFGSASKGIDACLLQENYPELIHFFEYGADLDRGLDEHVRRWAIKGLPTTYHFLDVNIEEKIDLTEDWLVNTIELAKEINAVWLCGDAGRWHFGSRERGHQMLMPPILCMDSVLESVDNIQKIQDSSELCCLPENPPALVYLGNMHILEYFAEIAERADCGLLLDCAHLAIFQNSRNHLPLTGFDNFPFERVIEVHVAGASVKDTNGYKYIDDDHSPEPIEATWEILRYVTERAKNLRAVVYECEHNAAEECLDNFIKLNEMFPCKTENLKFL